MKTNRNHILNFATALLAISSISLLKATTITVYEMDYPAGTNYLRVTWTTPAIIATGSTFQL
jgi:hypothetical protein